jgi:single-strand DNA-binding protein
MYQQITLVGRLGNDPEMRYTPSGVPVTSFSLAVDRRWTDAEGQTQEKTTWFRITAWRRQAEILSQYLEKGRPVLIIGEIEEARPWTDRDGNLRASLEVTARDFRFLGGRSDNGQSNNQSGAQSNAEEPATEDIPF